MKEFDLDKLERKNPYKVPENFFEEMQENVLKQTIKKEVKKPKVFKLNFSAVTSMAAALALVFGFTFLWKTDQAEITTVDTKESAENIKKQQTTTIVLENQDIATITEVHKIAKEIQNNTESLKQTSASNAISTKKVEPKSSDMNYDQLINSLSDEELKELTKNTDKDIYLELYN